MEYEQLEDTVTFALLHLIPKAYNAVKEKKIVRISTNI